MPSEVRLYLEGPSLTDPSRLALGTLARLLSQLEDVLRTYAQETGTLSGEEEPLASLVRLEKGSVGMVLQVSPTLDIDRLTSARWNELPPQTHDSLYALSKMLLNRDLSLLIKTRRMREPAPWIGAQNPVPQRRQAERIEDVLTLYGKVIRLGGVTPKVDIRVGGTEYHIQASEEELKTLEREGLLYKTVGLKVKAVLQRKGNRWQPETETLQLLEVLPYKGNPAEGIRQLAELTAEDWKGVDPKEFVRSLRG
ncbi:MAG: hypothetical protein RML14_10555 [Meiothermus sp.]|uniref:hypothetical protein n=1 Tax=Meiothermus sp. TaxID=1955249 RepID=UPI00298F0569|nr:hypothetical protein [Meiothermus sp.]MDW8482283.1 hypothetical protein [Meiothermus sp.]